MGHRGVIGGVSGYQGRDAEEHVDYQRPDEGVAGDSAKTVIDGIEKVAEGPKEEEDRDMQEHVYPVQEPPHLENFDALQQICSDTPTRVWSGPGIGKLLVVITPLLDESTSNRAHHAQEEAEEQHDINANSGTWGTVRGALAIAGQKRLVYFDDK